MVSDYQVRRLWKLMETGRSLRQTALRTGMDEKTARKYGKAGLLPTQSRKAYPWRTRTDLFAEAWREVELRLGRALCLEAKVVFEELQRRIKGWWAVKGPSKEVFFEQRHEPGQLCASDFTHMSGLEVRIAESRFEHLVYHFVLTSSNWESVRVCFSESFESLSEGLQHGLRWLGRVPVEHRTDCLAACWAKAIPGNVPRRRRTGRRS